MKSFLFGLCAALGLVVVGYLSLDSLQVSVHNTAPSDPSVVLNEATGK